MNRRLLIGAVGLVAIAVLFVLLRPGAQGETGSPSVAPTASTAATDPGLSPEPAPTVIEVTVDGGSVIGGGERDVRQGDAVLIRVTADVTDEVHLHGYDLHADVTPGTPGEVRFTANAAGVFEVELEDAGIVLLSLTVAP